MDETHRQVAYDQLTFTCAPESSNRKHSPSAVKLVKPQCPR